VKVGYGTIDPKLIDEDFLRDIARRGKVLQRLVHERREHIDILWRPALPDNEVRALALVAPNALCEHAVFRFFLQSAQFGRHHVVCLMHEQDIIVGPFFAYSPEDIANFQF